MEAWTVSRVIGLLGFFGMTAYFGSLVIWDEFDRAPQWLVWPAFVLMLVGVPVAIVQEIRHRDE